MPVQAIRRAVLWDRVHGAAPCESTFLAVPNSPGVEGEVCVAALEEQTAADAANVAAPPVCERKSRRFTINNSAFSLASNFQWDSMVVRVARPCARAFHSRRFIKAHLRIVWRRAVKERRRLALEIFVKKGLDISLRDSQRARGMSGSDSRCSNCERLAMRATVRTRRRQHPALSDARRCGVITVLRRAGRHWHTVAPRHWTPCHRPAVTPRPGYVVRYLQLFLD